MGSLRLNKLCEFEDFADLAGLIRELEPQAAAGIPDFPRGFEHRKQWEYAQLLHGAEELGAIRPDSMVLGVAAGHETPVYALTHKVRLVFATDIYGDGSFAEREAVRTMLVDPDAYAPVPYNRRRLVVQYMNALDLRYEPDTFDLVFSLSSVEHFGGFENALKALSGMARVCRPGGIVALATECIVNDAPPVDNPGLCLFSPTQLLEIPERIPGLRFVEPPSFQLSDATRQDVRNLEQVIADIALGHADHPHIVLELNGCWFTSVMLFFRKVPGNVL